MVTIDQAKDKVWIREGYRKCMSHRDHLVLRFCKAVIKLSFVLAAQQTFNCSKSTIETLKRRQKYVQS